MTRSQITEVDKVPGLKTIPVDSPEGKKLSQLYGLARHIRGDVIEQAIWIDTLISEILTQHLAREKDERILLGNSAQNAKALSKVVKRFYGSFASEYPDLFNRLRDIRQFRNYLAHAHLDTRAEFMANGYEDRIQVVSYKNGTATTRLVTVEESNKRLGECTAVMMQLVKLQTLVTATDPSHLLNEIELARQAPA